MKNQIRVLDCTLRDGGFALEDAAKNGIVTKLFDEMTCDKIGNLLSKSDIDIIEIGTVEESVEDKRGFAIYHDLEALCKKIPKSNRENQIYAAFFRGPDIELNKVPEWNPVLCEAIRVVIRYSEIDKSLDYCRELAQKGYKVFIQPMVTMRYTKEKLKLLIKSANQMNAYALYFVDSYGYMDEKNVSELFKMFDAELDSNINIGFHAHNNTSRAFSNVISFVENAAERNIIVDSCITGMGQGAGNMQTEVLVNYLNSSYGKSYDFESILEACEIIEQYNENALWGYSPVKLVPAANKTAYKYAVVLRDKYGLSLAEIHQILKNIPEELRQRYTPENAIKLLKMSGWEDRLR